ncbi:MAG TPA: amidohydrolase [Dehalococcoidia bacterium]|nr:amidohydrolase [Dehalococcoidia bacterium]
MTTTQATMQELKGRACARIDAQREAIVELVQQIYREPEIGFHEQQTAALVQQTFDRLGVPYRKGLALTGVKGELRGGAGAGPAVAIMGELDALIVPDHFDAHPQRQTAHACGHNGQIGSMIGAVIGLQAEGVRESLSGRVVPMAVPAEECIDIEGRLELKRAGQIEFILGKPELIRLGEFDDVDLAMIVHTSSVAEDGRFAVSRSNNGAIIKHVRYTGRAAHAGGAPQRGINALAAATLALAGIDAQRPTFRDEDTVRVHPIITAGGRSASIVPADVRIETFVRAKTLEAIADANTKVDRALRAGALALGAKVQITTIPGYMPLTHDEHLVELISANAAQLVGKEQVGRTGHRTGSTDVGDMSLIMPVVHPHALGAVGTGHGADYHIVDFDNAVINAAKAMAMTTIDLLADGGAQAKRVSGAFQPRFSKDAYLTFVRGLAYEREFAES